MTTTRAFAGAFEVELSDGRKLTGGRDVEEGALSLEGAASKVAEKLHRAMAAHRGENAARKLVENLRTADAQSKLTDVLHWGD